MKKKTVVPDPTVWDRIKAKQIEMNALFREAIDQISPLSKIPITEKDPEPTIGRQTFRVFCIEQLLSVIRTIESALHGIAEVVCRTDAPTLEDDCPSARCTVDG